MATLSEIKYFQSNGQIPDTNLSGHDKRVGLAVLNTTPDPVSLVIDDNNALTIKVAPFTAKSVPITIEKRVAVNFDETSVLDTDEYVEVSLYSEGDNENAGTYMGKDFIKQYIEYLKQFTGEV